MRVNENRNFDSADAPSQSWLSPHHQKAPASEPENFDSAALHLSRGLSPHQKESFQPLSNKFEQLKAFFFSLARSLHEKFA